MAKSKVKLTINEKALQKVANDAARTLAANLSRELNALKPKFVGKPVDEVKKAVQHTWARHSGGGSITDPELTEFAEAIQAGNQVDVNAA
ncbi:hypothetical protein [Streptomyces atriruber]|uniref:hypothetical protein n=1 Tax=Streptomyces atriruber TaxID=545121 RepID=UPI0006E3A395|nr:hypothetical protein [Streptomyces atriruber]